MALSEAPPHSCHDMMKSLPSSAPASFHSARNARASVFHDDDLWTACGAYEAEKGMPSSDDELSTVVSMASSMQHSRTEAFSSGLHRNASFDSGSTSHDSCTASFSTGSPVTVLPPLPYSCSDGKAQESCYAPYVDGMWNAHDIGSDCDKILASSAGGNFSSLLLNELPLRSYDDGVDQVCASNDYHLECVDPASISSQQSYDATARSGSTPDSRHKGIESSFCQEYVVAGNEYGSDHNIASHAAVGSSSNRSALSSPRTTVAAGAVECQGSPTARRRLSWTDHQWPVSSQPMHAQALLNNLHGTTPAEGLHMPHQFVNGFNNFQQAVPNFHDEDYVATCNQYRKSQTQDTNNVNRAAAKRPYSAMLSNCSNLASTAASTPASESAVKLAAVSNQQQDAAALSALLYKNNHGSDLIQQLQAGSSCITGGSAAAPRDSLLLPPPKLRRRHGTATDPQSIAARTRREKFSDRIRVLQSLVPNGERLDTVSMLGHTLEYVRFLQHQVWQLYNGGDDDSLGQPDSASREKWKEFVDTQTMS